jgi:hypothetical protein
MPAPLNPNLWAVVLHDPDGVPTTGGGGGSSPNQPTFACDQQAVPVPGTAVQLQSQAVPDGFSVFLRAKVGNTGTIWVGPDAATAQDHTKATALEPGAFLEVFLTNVDEFWIDADTAADGISWLVEVA